MTTIALRRMLRQANSNIDCVDDRKWYLTQARLQRQQIVADHALNLAVERQVSAAVRDRDRAIRERNEAVEREARMAPIHAKAHRNDRIGPETFSAVASMSLRDYARLIAYDSRGGYADQQIRDTAQIVAHKIEDALREEVGKFLGYGGFR